MTKNTTDQEIPLEERLFIEWLPSIIKIVSHIGDVNIELVDERVPDTYKSQLIYHAFVDGLKRNIMENQENPLSSEARAYRIVYFLGRECSRKHGLR